MTTLIGTGSNQVPTNGDLGTMAFQDGAAISVGIIYASGNVGIGTSTPAYNLDVAGKVRITSNLISQNGTNLGVVGNVIITGGSNTYVLSTNGLGLLSFVAPGSGPTGPTGPASTYALLANISSSTTNATFYPMLANLAVGNTAHFSSAGLTFNPSSNTLIIMGNVGIGTSSPIYPLHVSAAGGDILTVESTSSTDRATVKFLTNGNDWELGARGSAASPANAFYIYDNAASQYRFMISSTGNVGIGNITPAYKLEVTGSFAATTKSFVINHPTKPGMKLRYGSMEGPENGVYVRGKLTDSNTIELPEYWTKLVDTDSITVSVTPIGKHQDLFVADISNNVVTVGNGNISSKSIDCFYVVYGERCDVDKLIVEI